MGAPTSCCERELRTKSASRARRHPSSKRNLQAMCHWLTPPTVQYSEWRVPWCIVSWKRTLRDSMNHHYCFSRNRESTTLLVAIDVVAWFLSSSRFLAGLLQRHCRINHDPKFKMARRGSLIFSILFPSPVCGMTGRLGESRCRR